MKSAKLHLADGKTFDGFIMGKAKGRAGEVVFNTGMTGYVESLTDPSYAGQILVFTYPLIGNYGAQVAEVWESGKVHVAGVIVSELAETWSHFDSDKSLIDWLDEQDVPIMSGVDTRALTKYLRGRGVMNGIIGGEPKVLKKFTYQTPFTWPNEKRIYNDRAKKTVVLVDCGTKENIARSLVEQDLRVIRVPGDYDFTKENYDGIVVSNGPGNPEDYKPAIANVAKALKAKKPIFGICLGIQLIGLAAGAKTYKLKFGHRGHNQPAREVTSGKCVITSQNHGYALDAKSLPSAWRVSYQNLNDDSVEGIEHRSKPFFAVQFHPEAAPGPTDSHDLFKKFVGML
jgi:carbamoyl-phosphate synthase small subunit